MVKIVLYVVWLVGLMVVVACGRVATPTPSSIENTVVAAAPTSTPNLPAPTITPTLEPTLTSSPEPSSTATPIPVPTATFTPIPPQGLLFGYDIGGIWRVDVVSQEKTYLLTKEDAWLDWGARFAQNKKYLAYWLKQGDETELWFTQLPQWQPELVLTINDITYDFATSLWGVNDRYLFLDLSILDDSSLLEDIKTIRTYVIDTETMELVSQPYWSGNCLILAPSPQTGDLALWCSPTGEQSNKQESLVLELNETAWFTTQPPVLLTSSCYFAICDWSQDGDYVAFVATLAPYSLFYVSTNFTAQIQLDDQVTDYYRFPLWSPDGQFLYYAGTCGNGSGECPNIMSVKDQQVIWRTKNNFNHGEMGIIHVNRVVWSPDSQHIAIPTYPPDGATAQLETHILLFNVETQQIVSPIVIQGETLLDLVWVDG